MKQAFAAAACAACLLGCGSGGGSDGENVPPPAVRDPALTATLAVDVNDLDGDAVALEWKVTAGVLSSTTGTSVDWTLPAGGGLHFAYLTASDGKGGYVERQYALELGTPTGPALVPGGRTSMFTPPPSGEFPGGTYRATVAVSREFAVPGSSARVRRSIPLPDVFVQLIEDGVFSPRSFSGTTDERGDVVIPKLAQRNSFRVTCALPGSTLNSCAGSESSSALLTIGTRSIWDQSVAPATSLLRLFGHVQQADGSLCGLSSKYKNKDVRATVAVISSTGRNVYGTRRVNAFGDYAMPLDIFDFSEGAVVRFTCEGQTIDLPLPTPAPQFSDFPPVEVSATFQNRAPFVSPIQGRVNGIAVGTAVFDDPAAPSAHWARADQFLTYKGIDDPLSACTYYRSVGAVGGCDAAGNILGGSIRFDEWKRIRKLSPYNGSNAELTATYVNRVDLNLVRRMHAVENGPDDLAFYVCNHPGPASEQQSAIDAAIAAALSGRALVACVAMDYSVTPGINNNLPFTKFYVFGPTGELLTSVNLDGRGEKFVPGSCVICHGGDQYAGRFALTTAYSGGPPSGNLGARFLPFDIGNYLFSSEIGQRKNDQEFALKRLNLLVRTTEARFTNSAIRNLVDGWYGGNVDPQVLTPQNEAYVPPTWATGAVRAASADPATAPLFYSTVVARACRTCHVAMPDFDWDSRLPYGQTHVCGGSADPALNASMPNSKVTFDLLWRTAQQPGAAGDQFRSLLSTHLRCPGPLSQPAPNPAYR